MEHTTPLQPLAAPDAQLINALVACRLCLETLAARTGKDIADLLVWRSQSAIEAFITLFMKCRQQADSLANNDNHAAALGSMRTLLTTPNPIEQRRAAATMLRAIAAHNRNPRPASHHKTPAQINPAQNDSAPSTRTRKAPAQEAKPVPPPPQSYLDLLALLKSPSTSPTPNTAANLNSAGTHPDALSASA